MTRPRPYTTYITPTRLNRLIRSLKVMRDSQPPPQYSGIFVPAKQKFINRKKYSGKGRPKKTDYTTIDVMKMLRKVASKNKSILT